jgi:DNA-binding response OmpR family regulator
MVKVLLVEDDPDLREVTAYALRRAGFQVVLASDGVEALQRCRAEAPDLVLLDTVLPRLSGFEVCRVLRAEAQTPIIFVSARADDTSIRQGLALGAADYVTKPFSFKDLVERMQAAQARTSEV